MLRGGCQRADHDSLEPGEHDSANDDGLHLTQARTRRGRQAGADTRATHAPPDRRRRAGHRRPRCRSTPARSRRVDDPVAFTSPHIADMRAVPTIGFNWWPTRFADRSSWPPDAPPTRWTTRELERNRFRSADGRVDRSVPIVAGIRRRTVALSNSLNASPLSGPERSFVSARLAFLCHSDIAAPAEYSGHGRGVPARDRRRGSDRYGRSKRTAAGALL